MGCKNCKQIIVEKCDDRLCDIVVPSTCVTHKGERLIDILDECCTGSVPPAPVERLYLKIGELDYTQLNALVAPTDVSIITPTNGSPLPANAIIDTVFVNVIEAFESETSSLRQLFILDDSLESNAYLPLFLEGVEEYTKELGIFYSDSIQGKPTTSIFAYNFGIDLEYTSEEYENDWVAGHLSVVVEYFIPSNLPF